MLLASRVAPVSDPLKARENPMQSVSVLQGRLADDLQRLGQKHNVPGVSVAILVGDDVVEATFGVVNTRAGVPARRTRFS
jgi:CubicO group peptidase (beta-lactamase class C family)